MAKVESWSDVVQSEVQRGNEAVKSSKFRKILVEGLVPGLSLLAAAFLLPIGQMLALSVSGPGGPTLDHFAPVLGDSFYLGCEPRPPGRVSRGAAGRRRRAAWHSSIRGRPIPRSVPRPILPRHCPPR